VSVPVIPTPAQCIAGGGEDWNSGTNMFRVPKAGMYTVTVPSFSTANNISNITCQVIVNPASGSGIDSKSVIINTSVSQTNEWDARDVSVFVPEGGYIRIQFYIYQAPGTILFDRATTDGIFSIYLNEVNTPYMIANKGALVSSDETGKGKIDDDGTISISGELGTGTDGSKVSISRPDKWNAGIEYDFGGGLYGVRRTGSFISPANTQVVVGLTSFVVNGLVSYGGWWNLGEGSKMAMQSASPGQAYVSWLYERTNDHLIVFGTYTTFERTSGNGQYDVWVTYTK
jgi:hypothetical protein